MVQLVEAGSTSAVWFKILLYGHSGVGKTWRAAQARKPGDPRKVLVLLTEANGVQTARHANPSALLPAWPVKKWDEKKQEMIQVMEGGKPQIRHFATSITEVREIITGIQEGTISVDTLVIDGYTEIQQLMKDEITRQKVGAARAGGDKKKVSAAAIFSKADWGTLNEWMRRFLRTLRDLPCHLIGTALADVEIEEDGDVTTRYTVPSFQGRKLANQCMQYHNVAAYCYTAGTRSRSGTRTTQRLAMVEGPETILCKPAHPLSGVMEEPLWEWLDLLATQPGEKVGRAPTEEELEELAEGQEGTPDNTSPPAEDEEYVAPTEEPEPEPKNNRRGGGTARGNTRGGNTRGGGGRRS